MCIRDRNIVQRNTLVTDTILVLRYHPLFKSKMCIRDRYAAFGKVVAGMEVVDKIASVRTDWNDKPTTPVKMKTCLLYTSRCV